MNSINTSPIFKFALREDLKDCPQFLPSQGEPKATGYDVRAAQADRKSIVIKPGKYFKIPLGFRMFAPDDWWLQLNPRSSTFAKKYIHALYGVVDSQFESEMVFCGQYLPDPSWISGSSDLVINFGDAVAQLIPVYRQTMYVQSVTNDEYNSLATDRGGVRGIGGFGSTGG